MPVQMIELEEVSSVEVSDDALEAIVEASAGSYSYGNNSASCVGGACGP